MGSFGEERRKKAMWLYPKVVGFSPTERWGHSACCLDGVVYVFGGCCGGSHFSDVLALDLETMTWAPLATTGEPPGTRDSHTATLVGHRMVVFGGTNGSRKVNDVHVLDLRTREWHRPRCGGEAPCARESHTATVVAGERVVVFGGSGGGGGRARYLNDVHVLNVGRMEWTAAPATGAAPAARDSHTAVAVGSRVVIYGGDCGDRYHGEVDVLDVDTMAWSTLNVQGPSPGVRAGHAAVGIGTKVYIIGGVGDKHYYGDVWVLDLNARSWSQLDTAGQKPQGRFSHTAVLTNNDIAIYGGFVFPCRSCGEDERPLNELLVLQLGSEHPNGRYNVSMCKIFGSHWNQYKHKFIKSNAVHSVKRGACSGSDEMKAGPSSPVDDPLSKRKKARDGRTTEAESELEEHSLSLSQGSSPSHSDHEQNAHKMTPYSRESAHPTPMGVTNYRQHSDHPSPSNSDHIGSTPNQGIASLPLPVHRADQLIRAGRSARHELQTLPDDQRFQNHVPLVGAEVYGMVDGAFDSGYLMTANVNGQIFRGVLFTPGAGAVIPRPVLHPRSPIIPGIVSQSQVPGPVNAISMHSRPVRRNVQYAPSELGRVTCEAKVNLVDKSQNPKIGSDLQGVVLTLGGPGGCD